MLKHVYFSPILPCEDLSCGHCGTFGCVAMGSALLFIRSSLLVYSAGSGVNRVQDVFSGFSMRVFCFVQAKTLYRYGCMYIFGCTHTCVCGCDVVCDVVDHDLNRCTEWW